MSWRANEIELTDRDELTEKSREIARIWVTDQAGSSVWIKAYILEDPFIFGILMADTIRHAARAYSREWSMEEGAALQAIIDGLVDELRHQSVEIETIRSGDLN